MESISKSPQRLGRRGMLLVMSQPYLGQVATGEKIYDARAAYSWMKPLLVGHTISFGLHKRDNHSVRCKIEDIYTAPDFQSVINELNWQQAVPNANNLDQAVAVFEKQYPKELVEQVGGVVLIGFTKL